MGEVKRAIKGILGGFLENEEDRFASIPLTSRGGATPPAVIPELQLQAIWQAGRPRGALWAYSANEQPLAATYPAATLTQRWRRQHLEAGWFYTATLAWRTDIDWAVALEAPAGLIAHISTDDLLVVPHGYPTDITHMELVLEQYDPVSEVWNEASTRLLKIYQAYPTYSPHSIPTYYGSSQPSFAGIMPAAEVISVPNVDLSFVPYASVLASGWQLGVYADQDGAYPSNTGLRFRVYPYRQDLEPEGE